MHTHTHTTHTHASVLLPTHLTHSNDAHALPTDAVHMYTPRAQRHPMWVPCAFAAHFHHLCVSLLMVGDLQRRLMLEVCLRHYCSPAPPSCFNACALCTEAPHVKSMPAPLLLARTTFLFQRSCPVNRGAPAAARPQHPRGQHSRHLACHRGVRGQGGPQASG